jgi:hypothetical protein
MYDKTALCSLFKPHNRFLNTKGTLSDGNGKFLKTYPKSLAYFPEPEAVSFL